MTKTIALYWSGSDGKEIVVTREHAIDQIKKHVSYVYDGEFEFIYPFTQPPPLQLNTDLPPLNLQTMNEELYDKSEHVYYCISPVLHKISYKSAPTSPTEVVMYIPEVTVGAMKRSIRRSCSLDPGNNYKILAISITVSICKSITISITYASLRLHFTILNLILYFRLRIYPVYEGSSLGINKATESEY